MLVLYERLVSFIVALFKFAESQVTGVLAIIPCNDLTINLTIIFPLAIGSNCPDQRQQYGAMSDSRSCSCTCTTAGSSCQGANVILYNDWDCGGWSTNPVYVDYCANASSVNDHDAFLFDAGSYVAGTCAPGEAHSGGVSFTDELTLCCESG